MPSSADGGGILGADEAAGPPAPPALQWTDQELTQMLAELSPEHDAATTFGWVRTQLASALFRAIDRGGRGRLGREDLRRLWGHEGLGPDEEWCSLYGYICAELGVEGEAGLDHNCFMQLLDGRWFLDDSVYDRDGEALREFLVEADVALLRLEYLRALGAGGGILAPRGDLPPEALLVGAELERVALAGAVPAPGSRRLYVVSHAWLSDLHPDPFGTRLRELLETLDRLGAPENALVFFDFASLHQRAPGGEAPQGLEHALAGMDALFASRAAHVVVLPEVHEFPPGAGLGHAQRVQKYSNRLWCLVELSVASYFGRIANLDMAPSLPPAKAPNSLESMVRHERLHCAVAEDIAPAIAMYRRFYFSLMHRQVLEVISRGQAERDAEDVRSALATVNVGHRRELVEALGKARSLRYFAADILRLLMDPLCEQHVAAALRWEQGDGETIEAYAALSEAADWRVRAAAVLALDILDPAGSGEAAAARRACTGCFRRDCGGVADAARAVGAKSARGDARAVRFLAALAEASAPAVREAAAEGIGRVALPGDSAAAAALRSLLAAPDWRTRLASICALDLVDPEDDDDAARSLRRTCHEHLQGATWAPKLATEAVVQLESSAAPGDQRTLLFLVALQLAPDEGLRAEACSATARLARPGDAAVVRALTLLLRASGCGRVRREAAAVLSEVAPRERGLCTAALAERLRDAEWPVRAGCARALGRLLPPEDAASWAALEACFEGDPEAFVRADAVQALGEVAALTVPAVVGFDEPPPPDPVLERLIMVACARLEDGAEAEESVRAAILEVLARLSPKGEERVIAAALDAVRDSQRPRVRLQGARALAAVALRGHVEGCAALMRLMADPEEEIRRAAVQSLHRVTAKADRRVAAALAASLEDASFAVRFFATQALGEVFERGDQQLRTGQRVDVTASITGRHKGKKGVIARFVPDSPKVVVLLDDGALATLHERDLLVLSDGSMAALNGALADSHIAVRRAAMVALAHRRNADLDVHCFGQMDSPNPRFNPTCPISGRTPPSARKHGLSVDCAGRMQTPRGVPQYRALTGTAGSWKPNSPHPTVFSASPHTFVDDLGHAHRAAPWEPRRPETADPAMGRLPRLCSSDSARGAKAKGGRPRTSSRRPLPETPRRRPHSVAC